MIGRLSNLDRLVTFMAVIEKRSVTRAAESLYITQPCISKHIKTLEQKFGVKLLERRGKLLEPTEAGWMVYRFARNLKHSLEDLDHAILELRGGRTGKLMVGATSTLGNYLLPQLLSRFKTQNAGVDVSLWTAAPEVIYQAVYNGEIQLGVTTGVNIPKGLSVEVLCRDELVVVASPNHPLAAQATITPEELGRQAFVHTAAGTPINELVVRTLGQIGIIPNIVMSLDNPEAIKRAIEENVGVSILYRISVARELTNGILRELKVKGVSFWGEYNLISHPSRYQSPVLRSFLAFLRKEIVTYVPNGRGTEQPD